MQENGTLHSPPSPPSPPLPPAPARQTGAPVATRFPLEPGGALGYLIWAWWQAFAVLVSVPLALMLLIQFIVK